MAVKSYSQGHAATGEVRGAGSVTEPSCLQRDGWFPITEGFL